MFAGLDTIDWASMAHAYGPATEVPRLLRGLLSTDPHEREAALDGMYGAVHHQGDVYDCTVEAVPFLVEALADPATPDRAGILGLLASIGGADDGSGDDSGSGGGDPLRVRARAAVAAAYPVIAGLLADPDTDLRRAVPGALLACRAHAGEFLPALRDRLAVEPDPRARIAVVQAVGRLAGWAATGTIIGVDGKAVRAWLALCLDAADPAVRLAGVAEVAAHAPGALPSDVVTVVLDAVREASVGPVPAAMSGPVFAAPPPNLSSAVRELHAHDDAGRRAPWAGDLLFAVNGGLGDRAADRTDLCTALLAAPAYRDSWVDAIRCASGLVKGWRGRYDDLVVAVGTHLADPDRRLCWAAADALEDLHGLAASAAEAMAAQLSSAPRASGAPAYHDTRPPWVIDWSHGLPTAGPVLKALARLGDPCAVPALYWALDRPQPPRDLGYLIPPVARHAGELVPLLRRRLRDLPAADPHDERRGTFAAALAALVPGAVVVPDLLAVLRHGEPSVAVLRALGAVGPDAAEAVPVLRRLTGHASAHVAVAAALAAWRIDGDTPSTLDVLRRFPEPSGLGVVLLALADLGRAAAPEVSRLRGLLGHDDVWVRVRAAGAFWRATGESAAPLPVLLDAWRARPAVRTAVARSLAEIGPAAADAVALLRAELGRVRRHNNLGSGSGSHDIPDDEALLDACARALAAIGG